MENKKIIRVSADNEVTAHEFPTGTLGRQRGELCRLIGNGCDTLEVVHPKRLYRELGHAAGGGDGRAVCMLVDEEFMIKSGMKQNTVGSILYETDMYNAPILGNILLVGEMELEYDRVICGLHPKTFEVLYRQITAMTQRIAECKGRELDEQKQIYT